MEQRQQHYAGFWIRVLAGLIDLVTMGVVSCVPLTLILVRGEIQPHPSSAA